MCVVRIVASQTSFETATPKYKQLLYENCWQISNLIVCDVDWYQPRLTACHLDKMQAYDQVCSF